MAGAIFSNEGGKHLMPTLLNLLTSHLCDLHMATGDIVVDHVVSQWWPSTCTHTHSHTHQSIGVTDLSDSNGSAEPRL